MRTIKRSPKNKSVDYYVGDFETTTLNSDFYQVNKTGRIIAFEIQRLGFEREFVQGVSMIDFENWLLSLTKPSQVFFHNLAKFDGFILLNWALKYWDNPLQPRRSKFKYTFKKTSHGILSFSVRVNKIDVIFTDSYRLLSLSVASLGKILNLPKLETDYNINPVNHLSDLPQEMLTYLHQDVTIVNRSLINFKEHIQKLNKKYNAEWKWNSLTNSSISRQIIKHFDNDNAFEISFESQSIARKYYRGGYTAFNFKLQNKPFETDAKMYDAKSHYPSIMYLYELPFSEPFLISEKDIPKYKCVFVRVDGVIQHNKYEWGTIPKHYNDETYIFIEKGEIVEEETRKFSFYGTFTEWEISKQFYEFEYYEIVEVWGWKKTTSCLNVVLEDLYFLKETEKNPLTYKIILNSIYGSSGMKYDYPKEFYQEKDKDPEPEIDYQDKTYIWINKKKYNFFEKYKTYDYIEVVDPELRCWNRWIAAYITSIGRAILQSYILEEPHNAYYCDTDSILGHKDFKGFQKMKIGKNFGNWEEEYDDIRKLIIQGAKRYLLFKDEETAIKTRFAGIKDDIFDTDFDSAVKIMREEVIDKGQRRLKIDQDFFPFIDDVDYLNRKVKRWNAIKKEN